MTAAAHRLYLTQPAISAAIRRLTTTVGAPLFARQGRGLALNARGRRLATAIGPLLKGLVDATLTRAVFDPKTSDRTIRIGIADSAEGWLLSPLVQFLAEHAPNMRLIAIPVQFRNVAEALAQSRVDLAITVADDMPADVMRIPLFKTGFVCMADANVIQLPKVLTLARYLAEEHVLVSYNEDLRGVVEDLLGLTRRVRLSVPSFHSAISAMNGTSMLATLPFSVALLTKATHPHYQIRDLPFPPRFKAEGAPAELLWRRATDDDEALQLVRGHVIQLAKAFARKLKR